MSNESNNLLCLQKYIIKAFVQFFSNPEEVVTSRYVLYFDSKENIIDFDTELRQYIGNETEVNLLKAKLGILILKPLLCLIILSITMKVKSNTKLLS